MGPAYGNRPSTNPRGTGATLWGFEDSGATERVARCLRDAICRWRLVVIAVREWVIGAMRRRQTA